MLTPDFGQVKNISTFPPSFSFFVGIYNNIYSNCTTCGELARTKQIYEDQEVIAKGVLNWCEAVLSPGLHSSVLDPGFCWADSVGGMLKTVVLIQKLDSRYFYREYCKNLKVHALRTKY